MLLVPGVISGLMGLHTLVSNVDRIAEAAAARHNVGLDDEPATAADPDD